MAYKDPKDPRQKEAQRRWYLRNKEQHKARTKAVRAKSKDTWRGFKATLKCALCTENHTSTLDFHHIVRKPDNKKVHRLVADNSIRQAIKEIKERCVVLCANCHRKGHHYEKYGIPLDEANYSQYEQWFQIKSTKALDT